MGDEARVKAVKAVEAIFERYVNAKDILRLSYCPSVI